MTSLTRSLPYFPGGYTYATRCRGLDAIVVHLLREWVPFLVVVPMVYRTPLSATFAALIGWQGFYECGYLFNDLSRTASEPSGARLDIPIDWRGFSLIRIALLAATASVLRALLGDVQAVAFVSANIGLLGLLVAHTLVGAFANGPARIATFGALSVYKYAPLLVLVTGLTGAAVLLLVVFLAYGQARVVLYLFRKHPATSGTAPLDQDAVQAALLVALSPLILGLYVADQGQLGQLADAAAAFWAIHLLIAFSVIGSRLYRRHAGVPVVSAPAPGKCDG